MADFEISALEKYLFSPSRPLSAFPAGSELHYYFSVLACLAARDFSAADSLIQNFARTHPSSPLLQTTRLRCLLTQIDDSSTPHCDESTKKGLLQRLNSDFLHADWHSSGPVGSSATEGRYPSQFDEALLRPDTVRAETDLAYFRQLSSAELCQLDVRRMTEEVLSAFLKIAEIHRYPGIAGVLGKRIANEHHLRDIQYISKLTVEQLVEMTSLFPDLLSHEQVVRRLFALQFPHRCTATRLKVLQKAVSWAESLPAKFQLYQQELLLEMLALHMSTDEYPVPLFLQYAAAQWRAKQFLATAGYSVRGLGLASLPESQVIEAYLQRVLSEMDSPAPLAAYFETNYLWTAFRRAKLLAGCDPTASDFSPSELAAVSAETVLQLAASNPPEFSRNSEVALRVVVKNVGKLIVRTVELNALDYYLEHLTTIPEDLPLEGVECAHEVYDFSSESQFLQRERVIPIGSVAGKAGLFAVEFVAGGRYARAIIKKGTLKLVTKLTPAGHQMTVLDEGNQVCVGARVYVDGRHYEITTDKQFAMVPFAGSPKENVAIFTDGHVSELVRFHHESERYELHASFLLLEEALLSSCLTSVSVLPSLFVTGLRAPSALMQHPQIHIFARDIDGFESARRYTSVDLEDAKVDFEVPAKSTAVKVTFSCEVTPMTASAPIPLTSEREVCVNQNVGERNCAQLFLRRRSGEYYLQLLGKNGETIANHTVIVSIRVAPARETPKSLLATDEAGLISLGSLSAATHICAHLPENESSLSIWALANFKPAVQYPAVITLCEGDSFRLPFLRKGEATLSQFEAELRTMDTSGTEIVSASAQQLSYDSETATLQLSDLKPGNYALHLGSEAKITVRVLDGVHWGGHDFVITPSDVVQTSRQYGALAIRSTEVSDSVATIRLAGDWQHAVAHVFLHRFLTEQPFAVYEGMRGANRVTDSSVPIPDARSWYGRSKPLAEEYRYVLERSLELRFVGTTLPKPPLLLRPSLVEQSAVDSDQSRCKLMCDDCDDAECFTMRRCDACLEDSVAFEGLSPLMDFLERAASVVASVPVKNDGTVTVDIDEHAGYSAISVIVTNGECAAFASADLPEFSLKTKDLTLKQPFSGEKTYAEVRKCVAIQPLETLEIKDIASASLRLVDSLEKLSQVLVQVSKVTSNELHVQDWDFLVCWSSLSDSEKQEKYDKFCSHELNLFLYMKDRPFFEAVAKPFIASKLEKQLMDRFLLGELLVDYLSVQKIALMNSLEKALLIFSVKHEVSLVDSMRLQEESMEKDEATEQRLFDAVMKCSIEGSSKDEVTQFLEDEKQERADIEQKQMIENRHREVDLFCCDDPFLQPENIELKTQTLENTGLSFEQKGKASFSLRKAMQMRDEADSDCERSEISLAKQCSLLELSDYEVWAAREEQRPYFQQMERTKEYAETQYYGRSGPAAVPLSPFWTAVAQSASAGSLNLLSPAVLHATDSLTSYVCALAFSGLPFSPAKHGFSSHETGVRVRPASPLLAFYTTTSESCALSVQSVLCSQRYFHAEARFSTNSETGEREERPVHSFVAGQVYGCEVVITNVSVARIAGRMLAQVPEGAVPVGSFHYVISRLLLLKSYETQTIDYFFYFPRVGSFRHAPVNVSVDSEVIATSQSALLMVSAQPSLSATASLADIAASGDIDRVVAVIHEKSPYSSEVQLHLSSLYYLLADAGNFEKVVTVLRESQYFDPIVWGFGLMHGDEETIRELLNSSPAVLETVGFHFESRLVATSTCGFRHLDYSPMVNSRAYQKRIENDGFRVTYRRTLLYLAHKKAWNDQDYLVLVQYLLYQDRILEAKSMLKSVSLQPSEGAPGQAALQLQFDYIYAYLFPESAAQIASLYEHYPIPAWKALFAAVSTQFNPCDSFAVSQPAVESSLDFSVSGGTVSITYSNVSSCLVRLYAVDTEVLFSRNPFFTQDAELFTYVSANEELSVELGREGVKEVILSEKWRRGNAVVEVEHEGKKQFRASFSTQLTLSVSEPFGILQVLDPQNCALPRVYIKVFSQSSSLQTQFYKDGYTDVRGKFDYVSLATEGLEHVQMFAILAVHEQLGATVVTAKPPAR